MLQNDKSDFAKLKINSPSGIAIDNNGDILFCDTVNYLINNL